jgi:hypothetical protein
MHLSLSFSLSRSLSAPFPDSHITSHRGFLSLFDLRARLRVLSARDPAGLSHTVLAVCHTAAEPLLVCTRVCVSVRIVNVCVCIFLCVSRLYICINLCVCVCACWSRSLKAQCTANGSNVVTAFSLRRLQPVLQLVSLPGPAIESLASPATCALYVSFWTLLCQHIRGCRSLMCCLLHVVSLSVFTFIVLLGLHAHTQGPQRPPACAAHGKACCTCECVCKKTYQRVFVHFVLNSFHLARASGLSWLDPAMLSPAA